MQFPVPVGQYNSGCFQTSGSGCCSVSTGSRVVLKSTCSLLCRIFSMIRSFPFFVIAKIGTATPACSRAFLPAISRMVPEAHDVRRSAGSSKHLRFLAVKAGYMYAEYHCIRVKVPDFLCFLRELLR